MLTPHEIEALTPSWRTVEIDGLGAVRVKAPSEADVARATNLERPEWWLKSCVRDMDETPLFPSGTDPNAIDGRVMGDLKAAVFRALPTMPDRFAGSPTRSADAAQANSTTGFAASSASAG